MTRHPGVRIVITKDRLTQTERRWRNGVADLTLRDLIGYFEFHNRTEGKSPRTVDWYNQALGAFEEFLSRGGSSPSAPRPGPAALMAVGTVRRSR